MNTDRRPLPLLVRTLCCLLVLLLAPVFVSAAWVPIPTSAQPVDSLFGIGTYYTQAYADTDPFYSCAAYCKRFYQDLYNVTVAGLVRYGTPTVLSGNAALVRTATPRTGDLYFDSGRPHSAIVKRVEGGDAVLVEQNWKWSGQAAFERRVPVASSVFYRVVFRPPTLSILAPDTLRSGTWMTIRIGTNLRNVRSDIVILDASNRIVRTFLAGRVVNALSFTWSFDGRSYLDGVYRNLPAGRYRIYVRMVTATGSWTSATRPFTVW